jgi:hypothetical protein
LELDSEIQNLKKSFKEGGILTRMIICLSFFLSLSSLANLSEEIIKWKGFILGGLNLYKTVFVEFILHYSKYIGLAFTEKEIHVATISSICIATGMRVQVKAQKLAFQKISEKYGSEIKPNLLVFWLVGVLAPIGIWFWYGLGNPEIYVWWVVFTSIFLPVFMVVPKVILSKFSDHVYYERGEFSYFKEYYIYVTALLLALCVLAAINSAL